MQYSEQNFGMIGIIEAYDLANVTTTFNRFIPKHTVSGGEVNVTGGTTVPLYTGSAKMSESTVRGRGGDMYEVALSWQVSRPTAEDFNILEDMKHSAKCLKITAFGGAIAYILSDSEAYLFDYQRDGEFLNCSLKVYNISGIQQLV